MTEGMLQVLAGVSMCASLIGQVVDFLLTREGLAKGFKEGGIINKLVIAKWGAGSLPLATFLEATAALVIFGAFDIHGGLYGLIYGGTLAAALWANNIRSLKLLGKI